MNEQRKTVKVYMEGGVIQDVDVPKGVRVIVTDQDEIECGEQGTFVHDGGPDQTAERLAEALRWIIGDDTSDEPCIVAGREALAAWEGAQK